MIYWAVFTIMIISFYAWQILGFSKMLNFQRTKFQADYLSAKASIVIAYRNESENLDGLLNCLLSQTYEKENWQIIMVDDFSEDDSFSKVEKFRLNHPELNIKNLKNDVAGKKSAITKAVKSADFNIIVSTDADVTFKENWLWNNLQVFTKNSRTKLLTGPIKIKHDDSIFQIFQSLESMTLIGITAASIKARKPILCNAANMVFYKSDFINLQPFKNNQNLASGDDIFLLKSIVKKYGNEAVDFNLSHNALVTTFPKNSIKEMIQQRVRWASKLKFTGQSFANLLGLIVFLTAFIIVVSFILSPFNLQYLIIALLVFGVKMVIDIKFFDELLPFFDEGDLYSKLTLIQLIYILYVLLLPFIALAGNFEWKDRNYKV